MTTATTTRRKATAAKAAPKKTAPKMAAATVTDVVELDELADAIAGLRKVRTQIEKLEKSKAQYERLIQDALGDATSGTINGERVCTWSRTERKTVSVEMLRERFPKAAEACIKLVEVRTFRLCKPE